MADAVERVTKFKDAALVLSDDASDAVRKLAKLIRTNDFQRAETVSAGLQRAAREIKWLMQRLPK